MPNGKWVAFEGYDAVHDCKKPIARKPSPTTPYPRREKEDIYEDLSIPEVEIDKPGAAQQGRHPIDPHKRPGVPPILPPVGYEQPRQSVFSKVPAIVWWVAVGFLLFWLARST